MPELPDITVYLDCLAPRVLDRPLERLEVLNPFVLRTVTPPASQAAGRRVAGLRRLGKRVVLALEGELFIVVHLMIAGRLRWRGRGSPGKRPPGAAPLAALAFPDGTLWLTEAGSTRRASLHLVAGEGALAGFDRGGLEVLDADGA